MSSVNRVRVSLPDWTCENPGCEFVGLVVETLTEHRTAPDCAGCSKALVPVSPRACPPGMMPVYASREA